MTVIIHRIFRNLCTVPKTEITFYNVLPRSYRPCKWHVRCKPDAFHTRWYCSTSRWPEVNLNNPNLLTYIKTVHEDCLSKELVGPDHLHKNQDILVGVIEEIWNINDQVKQLDQLVSELKEDSPDKHSEMMKLADEDIKNFHQKQEDLKDHLLDLLLPEEAEDKMGIMMELSAGVGGQEAMLFTRDMFRMYSNYANFKGWQLQVLDFAESYLGGVRHACLGMSGDKVGQFMKFESGVHRVQRVPRTEKSGRIHTSTMTVAVLPQPTEIEVALNPKDLVIETKRASGAGGQNVNKVESAIRIMHIPTGIAVECQMERSQQQNRSLAMSMIRAKVYEMRQLEQTSKQMEDRKTQVGSASRSEKVRTYNFPQDRISDHRFNTNFHNMEDFLNGGQHFDSILRSLINSHNTFRLHQLLTNKRG